MVLVVLILADGLFLGSAVRFAAWTLFSKEAEMKTGAVAQIGVLFFAGAFVYMVTAVLNQQAYQQYAISTAWSIIGWIATFLVGFASLLFRPEPAPRSRRH